MAAERWGGRCAGERYRGRGSFPDNSKGGHCSGEGGGEGHGQYWELSTMTIMALLLTEEFFCVGAGISSFGRREGKK